MRAKNVRRSKVITSAAITNMTRERAHVLVERAERKTGSRMAAYEAVAAAVGASPGWLRKLIKGYEAKEPRATIYENIRAQYEALCSRVEHENELDEARLRLLMGNAHEVIESAMAQAGRKGPAGMGED